jgi:hypothetical protein
MGILKNITNMRIADAMRAMFVEFGVLENSRANDAANPHGNANTQHQNQTSTL